MNAAVQWWRDNRSILRREVRRMRKQYPQFRLKKDRNDGLMWLGYLVAGLDSEARRVKVVYPANYPKGMPKVYPLQRPRSRQHLNTNDGSMCVCFPGETWKPREDTAATVVGMAATWIWCNAYYAKYGVWPREEAPHGIKANLTRKWGRNELCPCGSGKKFKKCCMSRI